MRILGSFAIIAFMIMALRLPENSDPDNEEAAHIVKIKGLDFAFGAPDKISAGWTRFQFVNEGKEAHHMTLVRLENEKVLADFVKDFESGAPMKGNYTAIGGPNGVIPGGKGEATVYLKSGNYALLCFIPSPDGKMHLMKGMLKPITVTDKPNNGGEPEYNVDMTLMDYGFDLSEPLKAGKHDIRVTNRSKNHMHEVVLARLNDGVTVSEVVRWMHQMEGPPPAMFLGGISALSPMESNIYHVELEPGRYAWICPMIEGKDQKYHTEHGMMEEFIVQE